MSQSKSAITLNSLLNQNTNIIQSNGFCLPQYAVICISFSCSIHAFPLTFVTCAFFLYFLLPLLHTSLPTFLPPAMSSPLAESYISLSCQQRCRWCSEWWSFLWSSTSAKLNRSIRETPTPRSPFTTRYHHQIVSIFNFLYIGLFFTCPISLSSLLVV